MAFSSLSRSLRSLEPEASSFSSFSRRGWTYDVYLSFIGADTRALNFIDRLYIALLQAAIQTFRFGYPSQILNAIEQSRISVVVLSKNYPSSTWCLDELVHILECRKMGQVVLPLYYDIDPSQFREQTASLASAFSSRGQLSEEEEDKVIKWIEALREAGDVPVWAFYNVANSDIGYVLLI